MIVINHHHYYFLLSWFYSYRLISEVGICGYEMRHEARDCFCSLESSWVRKPIRRTSTPDVSDLFEHHSTQWGTSCAARLDELHIAGEVKYSNFVSNSTYPLFILICCKLHVPFIWILAALRFFQHLAGGWPHDLPFWRSFLARQQTSRFPRHGRWERCCSRRRCNTPGRHGAATRSRCRSDPHRRLSDFSDTAH